LELAKVKTKDNNLSEKDFLSIKFKHTLSLDRDDFESTKRRHVKALEVILCVEKLNWTGDK
jgi:hypothetical protein